MFGIRKKDRRGRRIKRTNPKNNHFGRLIIIGITFDVGPSLMLKESFLDTGCSNCNKKLEECEELDLV